MRSLRERVFLVAIAVLVVISTLLVFRMISLREQIDIYRENAKLRQDVLSSTYRYCELSERLVFAYGATIEKMGDYLGVQRSPITTAFFGDLRNRKFGVGGPADGSTD